MHTSGIMKAKVLKMVMSLAVMSAAVASPIMPAATATKPTKPLENAPAILSSIGRTDSVTASLRLPVFSWPYSMESSRHTITVI